MRLLLFFFLVVAVSSQAQNFSTDIKIRAMEMAKALTRNDFQGYLSYMHPGLRASAADQEQLKRGIDSAEKYRQQFGIKIVKVLIGNPSEVIDYKNTLQAILIQTTTVESVLGSIKVDNSLIALSSDKGKTWYFAEGAMYKTLQKEKKLPELSPLLEIPPMKQPVFIPKDPNQ
jgi:hypothetical protein